ncbi:LOW QUALITY PROTEIN: polycystin-1-like [Rhinophrynus dorsalis]
MCSRWGINYACSKTVIPDPHSVEVAVSLSAPLHCSVFQVTEFQALASVSITKFVWDFGNNATPVITTDGCARHKYSLPGQYGVRVQAEGTESGAETLVNVAVPVQGAELLCPSVVQAGQNVEVWLQVQQGTDLRAVYGLRQPDGHQLTGILPQPPYCLSSGSCLLAVRCLFVVSLPDVPMYLVGVPVLTEAESQNATLVGSLEDPQTDIETMLFPGLWFSHSGSPLALEFGVQPLDHSVQVRVQILRPFCSPDQHLLPPGCDFLRTPFATCHHQPLCNTTVGCPSGQQWCPLSESCLTITQPCSTYAFKSSLYPPRYLGIPPTYSPVADIPVQLTPSSNSRNIQVLLSQLSPSLSVQTDDILSIQHSGDRGSLLRCPASGGSFWSQSYISMVHTGWRKESLQVMTPSWVDDVVCDLHVTFTSEVNSLVISPLLGNFPDSGTYTVSAVLHNAVSEVVATCEVLVLRPVTDLSIVYPIPSNDLLHVATQDPTLLVISARSSGTASVHWSIPVRNEELSLGKECPPSVASSLPACLDPPIDTGFAWAWLYLDKPQNSTFTILVTNEISAQNLTVQIQSHDFILGLHIQPDGTQHINVNQTQVFTANVSHGSSVTFSWMIDNMEGFTYKGPSYSVTFRIPGSYRDIQGILPLQNAEVLVPSTVMLVSETQNITFQVQVDKSSGVSISWDFGDGSPSLIRHFSPPYDPHFPCDSKRPVVTLRSVESHIYTQEGHYQVRVSAYNSISRITRTLDLQAVFLLTSLSLQVSPLSPQPHEAAQFSIRCLPSHFEVIFSWDFGDGSDVLPSADLQTKHVYLSSGFYNVKVNGSNRWSQVTGTLMVMVGDRVEGLQLVSNGPTELGTDTVISGSLQRGTNVTWFFYMGDGISYLNQSNSLVTHTYTQEGNFTVFVVAMNNMSSTNGSITVQVYRIRVTNIHFPPVIASLMPTQFIAHLSVPAVLLSFLWDFGDGIPPFLVRGKADVHHSYHIAGNYTLQLSVSGAAGNYTYRCEVVVEDQINSVTVSASQAAANLSQPILFSTTVLPSPDNHHRYRYQWNVGDGILPINYSSPELIWTYESEGRYSVMVTAWNGVSRESARCDVIVQRPICSVSIQHNAGDAILIDAKLDFTAVVNQGVTAEFIWSFSDSSQSSSEQTVTHTFHIAGNVSINLQAKNNVSQIQTSIVLTVQTPVTGLSLTADSTIVETGQLINLSVFMSSGDQVQFDWSLCKSCPYIEGSSHLSHMFSDPGVFLVSVRAGNAVSRAHANVSLEVQERVQGVSIHQEHPDIEGYATLHETVILIAHVVKGSNLTFRWVSWPEQWESQESSFSFVPFNLGELWAEVWVQNALGSESARIRLQIMEKVSAVCIQTPGIAALGSPVELTVTLQSGTNTQYTWDPGEGPAGIISYSPSLTYTYLISGTKVIKVTVSKGLSSSSYSTELRVQEPVSEVNINVIGSRDSHTVMSQRAVTLCGSSQHGTDLEWEWALRGHRELLWYRVQNVSHIFVEPGQYWLQLHSWNAVSSANTSQLLNVQDAVTGLSVSTERSGFCTGQEVTFSLAVQSGTNLSFTLAVPSLNLSVALLGTHGRLFFPSSGQHKVLVTAYNQVSRATANLSIQILERVEDIQLLGLPPASSVNKTLSLNAVVKFGYLLSFLWTFQQLGYPDHSLTGHSVEYTPLRKGILNVLLNVSNPFCSSSLLSVVTIQEPVTSVTVTKNRDNVFLNQCIQFLAVPEDGSDLHFQWTFGDSTENISEKERSVEHCYSHPGDFVVGVFVYNLVSSVFSQTMVSVWTLKCEQPRVQLLGAPDIVSKAVGGHFEVSVDLRGCTEYKAIYQWELHRGSNCYSDVMTLARVDTSNPLLTIHGHTLDIGSYCMLFTATLQETPLLHNVTHLLTVTHSPLVAQIHGGSKRTWPAEVDLVLDGTESHDPDLREEEKETELEYEWSSELLERKDPACLLPYLPGLPQVKIARSALCAQSSYTFTLKVQKPGREPATTNQTVFVHSGPVLVVSPQCISCQSLSSYQISRSVPVVLSAECDTCHNDTLYMWSAHDASGRPLTLDNQTTSTGPTKRELVVRRGSLEDGLSYTFTLSVIQQGKPGWGEGSITLTPNNPPTGGQCFLLPQSTIVWRQTPLEYNCTGWTDPDEGGQLLFSLSVQICPPRGCQRLYLYRGTRSWHRVPAVAGSEAGQIQVFVEIEDMQGARTLALNRSLQVSVRHSSHAVPMTQLLTHSGGILQQLQMEGDTQLVVPRALEIVTALNLDMNVKEEERPNRTRIRENITRSVTSLHVSSLWDVAAISGALTQCVAIPHEVAPETWVRTLEATEKMIRVLDSEGDVGHRAESGTPQNLLTLLGSALTASPSEDLSLLSFNLTRELMMSLMRSHMFSEEPLSLAVPGVQVQGAHVEPKDLLCSTPSPQCQVFMLQALPSALEGQHELLQLVTELDINPFSSGLLPDIPVSTQLVSLEFSSIEGDSVAVTDLPPEAEIQLRLMVKKEVTLRPAVVNLPPGGTANFTVIASMAHKSSGLHLHVNISLPKGLDLAPEDSPQVLLSWGIVHPTNQSDNHGIHVVNLSPNVRDTQELSLLLPPSSLPLIEYQVNVTSLLSASSVTASVSLFSSLCQYFHMPSQTWRSEGMTPSNASQPHQVVCNTRHLTLFGASVFVPPHQLVLLPPAPRTGQRTLVLMICLLLLSMYLLLVLISHKLDHLDVSHVGTIPLCGQRGQYKYWVLVKTGWKKGAGTTAHVGISLYGLNKSGARHLESGRGLSRGSIEMFQVETDSNLGEVWKIRVWHDNTGLDPSWFLQYVAVWDKQTDFLYFFLVNDWLSVENERNGGRVEKEVLAACPQELQSFSRVFPAQLVLGFTDWHLWLSLWWRPSRSRFTRVQRVSCCAVTLQLYMAVCALWYGAVGMDGESSPVGSHSLVTWESVPVGVLVSLIVLPLQLVIAFLFQETRSAVTVEETSVLAPAAEEDTCDSSSLLSIPGGGGSLLDIHSPSRESMTSSKLNFNLGDYVFWQEEGSTPPWFSSCDSIYDSPHDVPYFLSSDAELSFSHTLRRKKGKIRLGFQSVCSSSDDPLSLSRGSSCSRLLTRSEENLLRSIAADTCVREESDSGRFSPRNYLPSTSPESYCSFWSGNGHCSETGHWSETGDWTETDRWSEARPRSCSSSSSASEANSNDSELQYCCDDTSLSPSSFTTRIGVRWVPAGWLFPSWLLWVVYPVLFILLAVCIVVTVLYSSSLSDHGILMWLISSSCALLTSTFLLEPLKVVLLSLFSALYRPPVLSEGQGLVEEPVIKKMSDHPCTIRAPGGFSLLQAKEEARRVRALRGLLRSCAGHMVFFLLVLMVNFQSRFHDNNIRLLHTAIKRSATRATNPELNFTTIKSAADLWCWLDTTLPVHLYSDPRITLVGAPSLCQAVAEPSTLSGGSPLLFFPSHSLDQNFTTGSALTACTNRGLGSVSHDDARCGLCSCQELGNSTEETHQIVQRLKATNWINERVLYVEITQYHRDVHLHVSTRLHVDLSPHSTAITTLTILPFHLQEMKQGLNLSLALSLSLLFSGLGFLFLELRVFGRLSTVTLGHAPCWTRLLMGLVSGAAGTMHVYRIWLAKQQMDQHREKPWEVTSLYPVALLTQAEVTLAATLLLLSILKVAQQLRFVRRWAVFGKTLQAVRWELVGSSLIFLFLFFVLTHCVSLVLGDIFPVLSISCTKRLLRALRGGSILPLTLHNSPLLDWCLLIMGLSLQSLCRGFLCALVLSGHRKVRVESYRPALEPQDHEMIDFLVKRFKLWLGLSKAKEYRHTVRFEGLNSAHSRSSNIFKPSRPQSTTAVTPRPASMSPEYRPPSNSPRPMLSPGLAVERLPTAVTDLLDRLEQVTKALEEVCDLEQRLALWNRRTDSCNPQNNEEPSSSSNKQQLLPRTYSTFSESALIRMRSKVVTYDGCGLFPRSAPESADLVHRARLLGAVDSNMYQRARQTLRRPHSEETSGGSKRGEDPHRPIPRKRRAWDSDRPGDT